MPNGSKTSLDSLLEAYGSKGPGTQQGANTFLQEKAPGMLESLIPGDVPGYSDIYSNFTNVVQTDLDKKLAGLRESFGSRGAAYSSDLARQSARARTEATERVIGGASKFRTAASQEAARIGDFVLGQEAIDAKSRQSAIGLMLFDYLKQTGLPEGMGALADFALQLGTFGEPTTVVT
jgi:hypothetical protein